MTDEDEKLPSSVSESTTLIPLSDTPKTYQSVGSAASSVTSTQSDLNGVELRNTKTETDTDILSERLLACGDNSVVEGMEVRNSFSSGNSGGGDEEDKELNTHTKQGLPYKSHHLTQSPNIHPKKKQGYDKTMAQRVIAILSIVVLGLMIIVALLQIGTLIVGLPSQPTGSYRLKEIQVRFKGQTLETFFTKVQCFILFCHNKI